MDKCYIIAEIGVNHNGDVNLAKQLVDKAVEAGVDAAKFQIFIPSKLVCKYAKKADYQNKNDDSTSSQKEMLDQLALSFDDFRDLKKYCDSKGIEFLSTAFDLESLDFLLSLNVSKLKIPSGEITNYPYLVRCAKSKLPIILSTGMAEVSEIRDAIEVLKSNGCDDLTVLHCTTEYPAPFDDINLNAMIELKKIFDVKIGYSDHSEGIIVPSVAVALGATVIEKHFTLDRNMKGPDHKASLTPGELKDMVNQIRLVERIMGSSQKSLSSAEKSNKLVARKSIVASKNIHKGDILTEDNICAKRPGTGISPMKWNNVIGTKAIRDFEEDEMIEV